MEKHVKILGVLYIGYHAMGLLVAVVVFGLLSGIGLLTGDVQAGGVLVVIGTIAAAVVAVMSIPGIIGGIGLLGYRPWARILVAVIGFLNVFQPPVGTAVGVYTLWVLLHEDTTQLFRA